MPDLCNLYGVEWENDVSILWSVAMLTRAFLNESAPRIALSEAYQGCSTAMRCYTTGFRQAFGEHSE